jgi:hypothetical protein
VVADCPPDDGFAADDPVADDWAPGDPPPAAGMELP